MTTFEKA